jgi:head-tail adaptor
MAIIPTRKHIDIGQFNQSIQLQTSTKSMDTGGAVTGLTWSNVGDTIWAKKDTIRPNTEIQQAGSAMTEDRQRFTVRQTELLSNIPMSRFDNFAIYHAGRRYLIKGINPVNNQYMFLEIEGVADIMGAA